MVVSAEVERIITVEPSFNRNENFISQVGRQEFYLGKYLMSSNCCHCKFSMLTNAGP